MGQVTPPLDVDPDDLHRATGQLSDLLTSPGTLGAVMPSSDAYGNADLASRMRDFVELAGTASQVLEQRVGLTAHALKETATLLSTMDLKGRSAILRALAGE
jgi:hypothetical protein